MAYGYNNDYRRAGGYRPSSRHRVKRKRNIRRIRNRVVIVLSGLIVCCVAVAIIVGMVKLVSGIASSCAPSATVPTATAAAGKDKKTSTAKKNNKPKKDNLTFTTPKIKDDGESTGVYEKTNGLYIWNKSAFELFYGSEAKAKEYAEVVSKAKTRLGKDVNVYSLLIPNHTEMGLPQRLKNTEQGVQTDSQANYIKTSYESMSSGVKYINAYNNLAEHCNEYIYFSSDHHWTGLGAYYAYETFAKETKQTPIALSDMKENKIEGFTGSFYGLSNVDLDKDTVYFWSMPFDVHNTVTQADGNKLETDTMYYWYEKPGSNTYGVFLFGDNPLEVIRSESDTASKEKIAIVHESYGNALVPYFAANYSEVHSIDFRSFKLDLKSYCEENGIKNVLFANGVMSSATEGQLESMRGIIG